MTARHMLAALSICLMLAACERSGTAGKGEAPVPSTAAATPSAPVAGDPPNLPLKELMAHVMQYSAEGIWTRQGYASDEKGERSLFPQNAHEWEEAESASLTLAELTNVLLLPGRRVDDPRWDKAVAHVRDVAMRAARASESKDEKALFEAGSELDVACESCHHTFAPWGDRTQAIPK